MPELNSSDAAIWLQRYTRFQVFLARTVTLVAFVVLAAGCSHKKPAPQTTLSQLMGKRVALAEVRGPKEAKTHVEVALLNELFDKGRFEIIDRATVEEARTIYPAESDWQRFGQRVGADYVLSMKVAQFEAKDREGLDKVIEEDSLLTEESGSSEAVAAPRYVKVKAIEGTVEVFGKFYDVAQGTLVHEGTGVANETVVSRDPVTGKDRPLPRKMQLLERLSHQAVRNFFERIPE